MRLDTRSATLPEQIIAFIAPISAVDVPPRQGKTSQVLFVESGRGAAVIKHATGKHLPALRHERTVLLSLQSLPLPLPIPLLFVEFPNSGWLVMSRLPGLPVLDRLRTEGNQEWRNALLHNLALSIARLHHTPAPPALMSSRKLWLEQMLAQAKHNLETGLGEGTKEDLDYLQRAKPTTVMPTLIHGDLFLDNVLAQDGRITGFIDWAFGAIGDYRYDLNLALYDLSADERDFYCYLWQDSPSLTQRVHLFCETRYILLASAARQWRATGCCALRTRRLTLAVNFSTTCNIVRRTRTYFSACQRVDVILSGTIPCRRSYRSSTRSRC